MAKKIRLGYDILSKRAIETESGVNIDDALKRKDQQIADINTSITNIEGDIADIQAVIPDDASSENKLITSEQVEEKLADILSNSDLIYLDDVNGDDTNDGLTKNTAVKTLSGAVHAFKNAQETNPFFTKVKVYVATDYQNTPLQIASDDDLAILTDYYDGIWIYGTSVRVGNAVNTAPLIVHYPLHIIAENVDTSITRTSEVSELRLTVECQNFEGNCMTTGSVDINASSYLSISSNIGPGDSDHVRPNVYLKSNGQIYVASASHYCNILNMTARGSIDIYGQMYVSYSDAVFKSLEGSVTFNNYLTAVRGSDYYLGVFIDACYGVRNNAGITCGDLIINAGKKYSSINDSTVTIAGSNYIHGNMVVQCYNFEPAGGAHQYYGDLKVKAEYINLSSAGNFYLHTKGIFIANKFFKGSPTIQANELYVKVNSNISIADNSTTDSYLYTTIPYRDSDSVVVNKNGKYVFEMGNSPFHIMDGGIQNPFADVTIISTNKVYLAESNTAHYSKSLNIKAKDLTLYDVIHTGFFNIDVDNMIEQSTPGCYLVMEKEYNQVERDYISYDVYSNNYLKCGSLYCSIRYTVSDGSCGLIQTSYGMAVKNIDIQVGMVLCPYYSNSDTGVMSPQVLGMCRSGAHTFNSTISGHVGGYVGYNGPSNFKVSAWDHDVRQIPPSYDSVIIDGNPGSNNTNGVISLEFDDIYETNHFWFDPDQGNDAFDGCTRQTAVKTVTGLVHAMMKKCNGSYDSTNNVFSFYSSPITIHILSVCNGNSRSSKWFSSPRDVYSGFSDWMNNNGNPNGLCFDNVGFHGGCRVQFNMLEFVPETPEMSLYARSFNANVLVAKGFYTIGLIGYGSSGINYLEASGSIGINNAWSNGGYSYYSSRLGPLSVKARDIVLYGWFNSLTAKAENCLYIIDSYGGDSTTSNNCCLYGITNLEATDVYLGYNISQGSGSYYLNKIGMDGRTYIKASGTIYNRVDTALGMIFLEAAVDIYGGFGDSYFKAQLHAKCNNCYLTYGTDTGGRTYYSFNTYTAASNAGGAGIIDIAANNQIVVSGWGTSGGGTNYLYGVDLYLNAPAISGNTLYMYGNNGAGRIVIDCPYSFGVALQPYYYSTFALRAGYVTAPIGAYSGGSFSPSSNTTMRLMLNIQELQQPIRVYYSQMSSYSHYNISGYIGKATCKVLYWGETIDPDNPPSIYPPSVTFDFALVVGHSTLSGHGFDLTDWVPDNSGTIIVLNDQKTLIAGQGINISDTGDNVVISAVDAKSTIVQRPVTISNGTATVSLTLNKYNVITGIDSTVTDLVIDFPVESTASLLTEIGFEFYLDAFSQTLNSVTFTNSTEQLSSIVPDEFTPEHIYQGVLVNRCITLVEYDRPDTSVLEINGVKYRTVNIGDQTWMAQNLADPNSGVWFNNDQSTYEPLGYGKLYTHSEAETLANSVSGWHLPTMNDYDNLITSVGGSDTAGTKLKSVSGWANNGNGTNDFGFDGRASGILYSEITPPSYRLSTFETYFWTSTAEQTNPSNLSYIIELSHDAPTVLSTALNNINSYSVRLVKDMTVNIGGRDYKVVQIGNQLWMAENLDWKFNGLNFRDSVNNPLDTTTAIQAAYYNYDESTYGVNGNKHGLLYNGYAAAYMKEHLDDIGVPDGWHIPILSEWRTLINGIGSSVAVPRLKSATWDGIDYYGFNSLATGCRVNRAWQGQYQTYYFVYNPDLGYLVNQGFVTGNDAVQSTNADSDACYSIRLVKNLI